MGSITLKKSPNNWIHFLLNLNSLLKIKIVYWRFACGGTNHYLILNIILNLLDQISKYRPFIFYHKFLAYSLIQENYKIYIYIQDSQTMLLKRQHCYPIQFQTYGVCRIWQPWPFPGCCADKWVWRQQGWVFIQLKQGLGC